MRQTLSGSELVDLAATGGVFVYVYDYVYVGKRLKDKKQDVELLVEGERGQVDKD